MHSRMIIPRHILVPALAGILLLPAAAGRAHVVEPGYTTVPIEPFVGRLNFSDAFDLETQNLWGLRMGLDFGPYFGLHGYYWRGLNDDFDHVEEIQSWGAESQFNLSAGPGVVPFLLFGVGRLDFREDFRDPLGNPRHDETALILGGGLGLDLAERLRLNLAARDYLLSLDDGDPLRRTDDLTSSWMVSAGLTMSLFGNSRDRGFASDRERARTRYRDDATPRKVVKRRDLRRYDQWNLDTCPPDAGRGGVGRSWRGGYEWRADRPRRDRFERRDGRPWRDGWPRYEGYLWRDGQRSGERRIEIRRRYRDRLMERDAYPYRDDGGWYRR